MSKKKFSRKNEWKQSRIDKKNHIRPEYHLIVTEGKKLNLIILQDLRN